MTYAYPLDELKPVSGVGFNTLGNFSLTLLDALDTLLIMGDRTSFIYGLRMLELVDFNIDVNVSVFETNIRILGGLLSCHILALTDPEVAKYYDGFLLGKARDVGSRLLVAFDTPTGLPYGTVNLMNGVNKDESEDVCTACAGSFSIEFTWLSILTDDPIYEVTARKAMRALWKRRSSLDLLGNHINVKTGAWTYKVIAQRTSTNFNQESSVGGLIDSFFEYLLKSYVAFSDEDEYNEMFWRAYRAVKIHMKRNEWHVDVHMDTGNLYSPLFHSLGAFWPGVKVMAGDVTEAVDELNAISFILSQVNFLPEALNLQHSTFIEGRSGYPLRPEFIESLWVTFQATRDPNILKLGMEFVDRLNNKTRTKFGFANVADVRTLDLEDKMESFFLAETLKYLYLLFDPENEFNKDDFVFNTEAHPFPV
ncbi:ER degradation-enhancing alpha-mannosidase-like protein 2 [Phlyctochytrium planicorne]|nr:ER degradation-enhancing alpha-mannosidase-like protein 2 [Phlyctochytrium planicorne]